MALRDQPYIPLYVQDFLTDEKLMRCSAEATGVYIRLMCVMHKSEQYGVFAIREKDRISDDISDDFARVFSFFSPYSQEVIHRAFQELLDEGVLYIYRNWLCQKRMIKDAELSEKRAKSGKLGAQKRHSQGDEFCYSKSPGKTSGKSVANTENENEYENEDIIETVNEGIVGSTDKEVGTISARGKKQRSRKERTFEQDSKPYLLAQYLSQRISARLPTIQAADESKLQAWADAIDKCNRLDGHSWDEIKLVLRFSQVDAFWQKNILSGAKFRAKYVQLLANMASSAHPAKGCNTSRALDALQEIHDREATNDDF